MSSSSDDDDDDSSSEEEEVQLPKQAFYTHRQKTPPPGLSKPKKVKKPQQKEVMELRDAKKQVYEYGVSGLSKRAQKIFHDQKTEAFGGKVKNPKMPFKMLLGIRKAEKVRAKRLSDEQRAAGVVAPTPKLDRVLRAQKSSGGKKKRSGNFDGDLKDGVLRVDHLLSSHQKKKRRS